MSTDVVMPQMGESIAEGTIVRWIKKVGDAIDKDEPLFEISTDKVDAEIPSPDAGVLLEIKVKEGETVPVNSVVAVIGAAGETSTRGEERGHGEELEDTETNRGRRLAAGGVLSGRRVRSGEPVDAGRDGGGRCDRGRHAGARCSGRRQPADPRRSAPHAVVTARAQDRERARHRHHAAERAPAFPAA